jgi:cell division protein FtsB
MPSAKPNRNRLAIGVVFVIVLAIVGALAWGFSQQLALARQMREEEIRLEQAVATERARNEELLARLEYVKSDEYVERWAREEAKMAKPEEVVVVPPTDLEEEESAVDVQPEQSPTPEARPFWIELWELIFGSAANP